MTPETVDVDFPPTQSHTEKIFEVRATFDEILAKHLTSVGEPTWWDLMLNKPQSLEDKLADLVIVLLNRKPESWKFTGETPPQASYEDMHIKVNYPSAGKLVFSIRTMDHKTEYSSIRASRRKRKALYQAVLKARDHKLLASITTDIKKQVLLITDNREKDNVPSS